MGMNSLSVADNTTFKVVSLFAVLKLWTCPSTCTKSGFHDIFDLAWIWVGDNGDWPIIVGD